MTMKIIGRVFAAITLFSMLFVSCQETKDNEEKSTEPEKVKTEVKAEKGLKDTIGVYKISNAEARDYIVKMNELIVEIDKAMDKKNLSEMPGLMMEIGDNQKKQLNIQSELSEPDMVLFKTYNEKISNKLIEQGDRMSNM